MQAQIIELERVWVAGGVNPEPEALEPWNPGVWSTLLKGSWRPSTLNPKALSLEQDLLLAFAIAWSGCLTPITQDMLVSDTRNRMHHSRLTTRASMIHHMYSNRVVVATSQLQ